MKRSLALAGPVILFAFLASTTLRADDTFVHFESGPVRPLALSPVGSHLFAANIPDNRVEIFEIDRNGGLRSVGEVVVGLEPVAIAARDENELWVVNHLSDSVSVVDVSDPTRPFVKATALVGDEPRDIVIAGVERDLVFITTAHRGQNGARDPELTTPGVGRADVWIFDANDPSSPIEVLTLFCDTPRALAVSPDRTRVYAASFFSGNRTSVLTAIAAASDSSANLLIDDGFSAPGMPPPLQSDDGVPAPDVGVIVRFDDESGKWLDSIGRDWTPRMRFNLPDKDVFTIDATADPPREIGFATGVGTTIFNLAVHPVSGKVYASNLDARNIVRFEPGVRGHIAESRVTIIDPETGEVSPVHINPHIDFDAPVSPPSVVEESLAFPLEMAFEPDGEAFWVAAFGSSAIGLFDADGGRIARVSVGGGPSGLARHPLTNRLYVLNRFDHTISIVDTAARQEIAVTPLRYNPEPEPIRVGRPLLYDARNSAHGDSACASCHIFGDTDHLAWDLGDPAGAVEENPLDRVSVQSILGPMTDFHPLKGPMTTQSLRGLEGAGAMHWRGDRNGVNAGEPNPDVYDEGQAFLHFRGAFQTLLGMGDELPRSEMEKFRDFILTVRYPPNPIANIDGSLTPEQQAGRQIFLGNGSRTGLGGDGDPCTACHELPFGTGGRASFELEPQEFKVAHLRNLYQKVGMFGYALPNVTREPMVPEPTPTPHLGDQVRGFGFLHDGSIPTLFNFFRVRFFPIAPFTFPDQPGRSGNQKVRELEAFLLTFDTGLAPVVGHQVTLDSSSLEARLPRYNVLRARADAGDCDLVAHAIFEGGERRAYLYTGGGNLLSDREAESTTEVALRSAIENDGAIITVTAVPPGTGRRIALDRDEDGAFDGDEIDFGSDPADPTSVPFAGIAFLRGNCNGDGTLDLADAVFGLGFLFQGGSEPVCRESCDANGDGRHDLSDAVYTLGFLFLGTPAPGAYPECESVSENCATNVCP